MTLDIATNLKFTFKEGYAFIQTPHQTMLLKPKRHELATHYVLLISRILDNKYTSIQEIVSDCNEKIELVCVEKGTYALYLD